MLGVLTYMGVLAHEDPQNSHLCTFLALPAVVRAARATLQFGHDMFSFL